MKLQRLMAEVREKLVELNAEMERLGFGWVVFDLAIEKAFDDIDHEVEQHLKNKEDEGGMARITYDLEIPDDDLKQMNRNALQQTDGRIGWGDVIDDTLQSAAKKICPRAKFVFVDFHRE